MRHPTPTPADWATLEAQLNHHPVQHAVFRRLQVLPVGVRFKRKHLLSDTVRPDGRGGAVLAANAVIRRALALELIRVADGIPGLVPYYEKVK